MKNQKKYANEIFGSLRDESSNSRPFYLGEAASDQEDFSTVGSKVTSNERFSRIKQRRYTEDLDGERLMLELNMARSLSNEARNLYNLGNYFDAIEKINDSIDSFSA